MLQWLQNLLGISRTRSSMRPASGMPKRVQLLLEVLEDRCVPAAYLWVGGANATWGGQGNWRDQNGGQFIPGAGDEAIFNPALSFNGVQGTNTNLSVTTTTVGKLTIAYGYTGTITIDDTFVVGQNAQGQSSQLTSTMLNGTIAGDELVIDSTFIWAGGTWTDGISTVNATGTLEIQLNAS